MKSILVGILLSCASAMGQTTLRVAADEWMPFNGAVDSPKPGYVVELLQKAFTPSGIEIDYRVMPYTDALAAARTGEIDAVIGANVAEGAGLLLPKEAVGAPVTVLVCRKGFAMNYENVRSLRGLKLGVVEGYSYFPGLDEYIKAASTEALWQASGENALKDLVNALVTAKVDVIAETEVVLYWWLKEHGLNPKDFQFFYRHEPDPIYIGFRPGAEALAAELDKRIKLLRANGELVALLQRYGLRDWSY